MINAYSFTRMLELLMEGPVTKSQLIEETGLHHATVGAYVRHMHRKRLVRIEEYRRDRVGRTWVPYFSLNVEALPDAKKPARTSSTVRSAIHREKKRAIRLNQMLAGGPT